MEFTEVPGSRTEFLVRLYTLGLEESGFDYVDPWFSEDFPDEDPREMFVSEFTCKGCALQVDHDWRLNNVAAEIKAHPDYEPFSVWHLMAFARALPEFQRDHVVVSVAPGKNVERSRMQTSSNAGVRWNNVRWFPYIGGNQRARSAGFRASHDLVDHRRWCVGVVIL
tara:strand:- start:728 stop:1228 length:501 start_codon:yes stop_codon:yes gene_type:complete